MEIPTQQNHVYTLTCDNACEVYDVDTDRLIHVHHAGEVQSQFTAIGMKVRLTDDTAHITELFNGAPAGNGGGGYIESNLNVGHGASAAVAAQCTLTLGDLATGGTLTDSNGQSVELDAPHKYATGTVSIPDATAAGTLAIGEWSREWEAQPGSYAAGYFLPNLEAETQLGGTLKLMRGEEVIYSHEFAADVEGAPWTIASVKAELEADADWPCTILDEESEIDFQAPVAGESWNDVELVLEGDLFSNQYYGGMSGGGVGARTAVDVFNDIHNDENCPVDVTLDADEMGLGFTAKEYGVNDEIAITGSMFSDAVGMSGGHGDYTVAELVTAIDGEFDDITPTAGETEGTITLTANDAGADANAITYTATGCFGSGTVKQGSTTRGKNAVTKTSWRIYLNGDEFSGGGTPSAPVPEVLVDGTELKHGHVYTVAAAGTALDYSAVTLADYTSAEIWITCTADTNVTWPDTWSWVDGIVPPCKAGNRYFVRVWSDGHAVVAELKYSYANA